MHVRLNWAVGIVVTYVLFACGTVGVVVFALSQPVDLVSPDYYGGSLKQDERTAAIRNADALGATVAIAIDDTMRTLDVRLPAAHRSAVGRLTWYRPAGSAADVTLPLRPDAVGSQRFTTGSLARGRWIVQLEWEADGSRYYREQAVTLR